MKYSRNPLSKVMDRISTNNRSTVGSDSVSEKLGQHSTFRGHSTKVPGKKGIVVGRTRVGDPDSEVKNLR
jgi:hypothetical protein